MRGDDDVLMLELAVGALELTDNVRRIDVRDDLDGGGRRDGGGEGEDEQWLASIADGLDLVVGVAGIGEELFGTGSGKGGVEAEAGEGLNGGVGDEVGGAGCGLGAGVGGGAGVRTASSVAAAGAPLRPWRGVAGAALSAAAAPGTGRGGVMAMRPMTPAALRAFQRWPGVRE